MNELRKLLEEIRRKCPEIDLVSNRIGEVLVSGSSLVDQLSHHLLSTSGKRIRPTLVILSSALGRVDLEALVDAATAVELVHLASLVHDDVIDECGKRRGRPTVSRQWGNYVAVLAGDYLFASAFGLLTQRDQHFAIEVMADAVRTMCEGEIEQALCARSGCADEDAYFSQIEKKTACLMGASCLIGARLAGAPESQAEAMRQYGLNLGCAFQIMDDLLDVWGDEDAIGKPTGSDLKRGLSTLPLIRLARHNARGRTALTSIHSLVSPQQVGSVMMESGVIGEIQDEARTYANRAIQQLDSVHLSPAIRGYLARLALAVTTQM